MNRILILVIAGLLGIGFVGWKLIPSHYCGVHCGIQWWVSLKKMSDLEHAILEAAEGCRDNPQLVLELEFQDICELNYDTERAILRQHLP